MMVLVVPVMAEQTEPVGALVGCIIFLDAGHGNGADNVFMGYSEGQTMLRLALMIKPLLEEHGATVILTRPTEANVSLPMRVATINLLSLEVLGETRQQELYFTSEYYKINYLEAQILEIERLMDAMQKIINDYERYAPIYFNFPFDWSFSRKIHPDLERIFELQTAPEVRDSFLVISLHSNATSTPINTATNGADIFIMTESVARDRNYFAYYTNEDRSRYFANILLDNIHEIGIQRRGVQEDNWFMIREHNLPGALAENGFHTNPQDRALLSCNYFLQRLALAYEDAIIRYFEGHFY